MAEQLGALEDLRQEGKLDLIGISNASADTVRRALELVDIACVQNRLQHRQSRPKRTCWRCARSASSRSCRSFRWARPSAGGPRQLAADPAIAEVAARRRATPSQIALAWLLHRSDRILLIPGTSSIGHLEENIAAGDVELDERTARARRRHPARRPDGRRRPLRRGSVVVQTRAARSVRARRGSLRPPARRSSAGAQAPRSARSARGAGAASPASGARSSWCHAACR